MTPELEELYDRLEGLSRDCVLALNEWQMAVAMYRMGRISHPDTQRILDNLNAQR